MSEEVDTSSPEFGGNNYYWDSDGLCFFIDKQPGYTVVRRMPFMDQI